MLELYNSRNPWFANDLRIRIFTFLHFNLRFVHIKYTSNMAAWIYGQFSDVTAF